MQAKEWSLLLLLSLVWGGSFFFQAVAVRELPPLTIVAARVGLAAIILHIVMRVIRQPFPTDFRILRAFFIMGLINNVIPFSLIVWGQVHVASGVASIFNAATPIMGVIVAHFLTRDEKLTGLKLAGVIIGFLGVTVMVGVEALAGFGTAVWAQLAIVAASLAYAFAGVFGKSFKQLGVTPLATATGQVTASAIIMLLLASYIDTPWRLAMPSWDVWGALVGVASISTAFAYLLYFRILEVSGATNLLLVTFIIPVVAISLGIFLLGETLQMKHILGMIMIALGLSFIDGRLYR